MKKILNRIGKIGTVVFFIDLILIGLESIVKIKYPDILIKIIMTTFLISIAIIFIYYGERAISGYIKVIKSKDKKKLKEMIGTILFLIVLSFALDLIFKKQITIERVIRHMLFIFVLIGVGYNVELK